MVFHIFCKRVKKRLFLTLFFLIVAFSLIFAYIDGRLTPLIRTLASAHASRTLNDVASNAAAEYIKTCGVSASDLVEVRSSEGGVSAVYVNAAAVNLLASGVSSLISERLSDVGQTFSVPLGNLFSGTLLAGRGPDITVRLLYAGGVSSRYESTLSTAGINQTLHRVVLCFTVSLVAAVGARDVGFETTAECMVCETVIVGKVPTVYVGNGFSDRAQSG